MIWYSEQVDLWLREFRVEACRSCPSPSANHLEGSVDVRTRTVHYSGFGRTRPGLVRWAAEIGLIVLAPAAREQARRWALELMERDGYDVSGIRARG